MKKPDQKEQILIQAAIAVIEKYRKEMSDNQAQRLYELLLKND